MPLGYFLMTGPPAQNVQAGYIMSPKSFVLENENNGIFSLWNILLTNGQSLLLTTISKSGNFGESFKRKCSTPSHLAGKRQEAEDRYRVPFRFTYVTGWEAICLAFSRESDLKIVKIQHFLVTYNNFTIYVAFKKLWQFTYVMEENCSRSLSIVCSYAQCNLESWEVHESEFTWASSYAFKYFSHLEWGFMLEQSSLFSSNTLSLLHESSLVKANKNKLTKIKIESIFRTIVL